MLACKGRFLIELGCVVGCIIGCVIGCVIGCIIRSIMVYYPAGSSHAGV